MKRFLWLALVLELVCGGGCLCAQPQSKVPSLKSGAPASLPMIYLDAREPIRSEAKVPCRLVLNLPGEESSGQTNRGVVRYHGASSQGYPKKSYGLSLETATGWLSLPTSVHWVLNAAAVDPSLMRHKLSYDLFQSLSSPGTPRRAAQSRFVEVTVNGRYEGVYLLMERVNRSMLRLQRFDSNAPTQACIYKAIDHAAGFDHEGHEGFRQIEPEPTLGEYWKPLDELMHFASRASRREFFDPVHGIGSRLDLDNAIDFHLLILLTSNMDGFDKNLILARDAVRPNAPAPRFFFVPWDYDATFGENWEGSPVSPEEWLSNQLFDRLLQNPDYARRFAARWKQLRQHQFQEKALWQAVDDNAAAIGPAVSRNARRWSNGRGTDWSPRFRAEVGRMKRWISERLLFLDRAIAERTGQ